MLPSLSAMAKPSMATTLNSNPTLIKQENHSSPSPPSPPQREPPPVKPEPQDLSIVVQQPPTPLPPKEPQFLKSIEDLAKLSTAIDRFKRKFDELQKHFKFIDNAIVTRFNELKQKAQSQRTQTEAEEKPTSLSTIVTVTAMRIKETETDVAPAQAKSEIVILCETMSGRGLRKYIVWNLSDVDRLREEVPAALKCAPKPAKLVLDCIGRFYLQGSKAYEKESPMISGREASVLILEFFLLSGFSENEMEDAVKQEAEQGAVSWRKRLIAEGGVRRSVEIDAKGLLLFIGGFGIPKLFSNEDIFDLVKLSNSKQFADVIRRSRFLVARVTDIIEGMMKKGMKLDAVDVACIFGIENKFPAQNLLTLFLEQSKAPMKGKRGEANNSPVIQKETKEKQLGALKSVVKFLEERQLDPTELLPGWQCKEKIIELEKDIADLNKKINKSLSKRPANANEVSNYWKSQDTKRPRFTEKGSPLISSPGMGLHDHIAASYLDGQSSYNRMMRLDGGLSGLANHLTESRAQTFPENVLGVAAPTGIGLSAAYGGSVGVHRQMLVDGSGQVMGGGNIPLYAWHRAGDIVLNGGSTGHQQFARGLFVTSPSAEGFAGFPNSPPAVAANGISARDLYQFADAPSLATKLNAASDLYGFADAPSVTANQIAASNLYGFADAIIEGPQGSGRHTGPLPPGVGSHHSSHLYQKGPGAGYDRFIL